LARNPDLVSAEAWMFEDGSPPPAPASRAPSAAVAADIPLEDIAVNPAEFLAPSDPTGSVAHTLGGWIRPRRPD
jgi:hypothetical protein